MFVRRIFKPCVMCQREKKSTWFHPAAVILGAGRRARLSFSLTMTFPFEGEFGLGGAGTLGSSGGVKNYVSLH